MGAVIPGRFTAAVEGPFVVFIIGFRVNEFFAFRKWWPVASAMQPMIESLYRDPGKGLLAAETFVYWPGPALVRYESVYNNMPRFGLARAGENVPATGRRETARRRLGQEGEPSVPTPAQRA